MSNDEKDKKAFKLAEQFLLDWEYKGSKSITLELLQRYEASARCDTLEKLYERLLGAVANPHMMPKVVVKPIGGIPKLKEILCGFNPESVIDEYGDDYKRLLDDIGIKFPILQTRKSFENERGLWVKFCKGSLSGAKYLKKFKSAEEFYAWADKFTDKNGDTRMREYLAEELVPIYGIGFALACDFLKEIGRNDFAKPDLQLRKIFVALELCDKNDNDVRLFRAIIRVAGNANVTPYKADKWFWLIATGNFGNNPELGKEGKIGERAEDFIRLAKGQLDA